MLKTNRGVTLTSLVIYVIVLMIVISIMSVFSRNFYKGSKELAIKDISKEQYTKFLSYITKDINSEELRFIKSGTISENEPYLIFKFENEKEHQYILTNDNIYFLDINDTQPKKILLCQNASTDETHPFEYSELDKKINIKFSINKEEFSTVLNINL